MIKGNYRAENPFITEGGIEIRELNIRYTTYGKLSEKEDNVIWIIHAYTANSEAHDWWSGLVGEGKLFDPGKHFIVCANNPGSCYGTTGPTSVNPATGKVYGKDFPLVTVRDSARVLDLLRQHLGISKIRLVTGGSIGGQIALEWAVIKPELFDYLVPIATNAKQSPWAIAFNEAQRMALEAGSYGLQAARAVALLSYRGYSAFNLTQSETEEKTNGFRAASYQRYQGKKLTDRFDSETYYTLSKVMDSHDLGRGRGSLADVLKSINAQTLVIGISSDILFPVSEQKFLADNIPGARLEVIDSDFGHDGFLIENDKLTALIRDFTEEKAQNDE
ncbi:MAG: homoserine O-acetyltransferase [Ignavibacteriaceae bacterium]|nr:homoserine O-acetyltransferase [Ignavibacteriaceae bacterium]